MCLEVGAGWWSFKRFFAWGGEGSEWLANKLSGGKNLPGGVEGRICKRWLGVGRNYDILNDIYEWT